MMYRLYKTIAGQDAVMTVGVTPELSFICDPDNTDYQQYLKWLEEGNTPEPAEEQQ